MARRLRLHVPDGWYHVMSRGNGEEVIYCTDEDRRRFLGLVAELPERFGTEIHAFVLMDNRSGSIGGVRGGSMRDWRPRRGGWRRIGSSRDVAKNDPLMKFHRSKQSH